MKKFLFIIIMLSFALFLGCTNNKNNKLSSGLLKFNISEWNTDKELPEKLIKNVRFIPLETTKDCLIGKISKIKVFKDNFYILDKEYVKKILVYTNEGKYLKSIGRYGKGEGEYININDFTIDHVNNRIIVLDNQLKKLIYYSIYDGKVLGEIKMQFSAVNIAMPNINTLSFFSKNLYIHKPVGYAISNLIINDKYKKYNLLPNDEFDINLSHHHSLFESNSVYYAPFLKGIVYKLFDNNIFPVMQFDFGKYQIPEEQIIKARRTDSKELFEFLHNGNWIYGIRNILENDEFISLNINIKNKPMSFIYSKETGRYLYGNSYQGALQSFKILENIAVEGHKFYAVLDAFIFKRINKSIYEGNNKILIKEYQEAVSSLSNNSNPIIIVIGYNKF